MASVDRVGTAGMCYRLAEVGVLETPKLQGKYDTGQVGRLALYCLHVSTLFVWILMCVMNIHVVNNEYYMQLNK